MRAGRKKKKKNRFKIRFNSLQTIKTKYLQTVSKLQRQQSKFSVSGDSLFFFFKELVMVSINTFV